MLLLVRATADNRQGPVSTEQVLTVLHGLSSRRLACTLMIGRIGEAVGLFCQLPAALAPTIRQALLDAVADCQVEEMSEDELTPDGMVQWTCPLRLVPDARSIRTHRESPAPASAEADPLTHLLSAASIRGRFAMRMELTVTPASRRERRRAEADLRCLSSRAVARHRPIAAITVRLLAHERRAVRWFSRRVLHTVVRRRPSTPDDGKLRGPLFSAQVRLAAAAAPSRTAEVPAAFQTLAASLAVFAQPDGAGFQPGTPREEGRRHWWRLRDCRSLLSSTELATLWHPTTATVHAAAVERLESRELPPPDTLPPADAPDAVPLGQAVFRGRRQTCVLKPADRRRHLHIVGKTGTGKTSLLTSLITADILCGRGVAVIDPHGDLVSDLLRWIPRSRTNDVVLIDPADASHPVAFNPLHSPGSPPHRTADGVLAALKKMFGDSWGPRLEHTLGMSLATLCSSSGHSLLSIPRLLTDNAFRSRIVSTLDDPLLRSYWSDEFAAYSERFRAEVTAPILNKVGQLLRNPLLRNILGQSESRLDLRRVLDQQKVLLINVSKGRLGEIGSSLLGSLLLTRIEQAALGRADQAEAERTDTFLYVDEFQNFATESFSTVLSESRKYRLSLTLAHQYLGQLEGGLRDAVFGNVGSLVCFQAGADDAEAFAAQLGNPVEAADLLRIPRYRAYTRLLIDGQPSRPFTMETAVPRRPPIAWQRPEVVRQVSRERYGTVV